MGSLRASPRGDVGWAGRAGALLLGKSNQNFGLGIMSKRGRRLLVGVRAILDAGLDAAGALFLEEHGYAGVLVGPAAV